MQVTVSGKQIELSEALKTRVTEHLNNMAARFFVQAMEAHVTFSRARSFFTCDVNLHAARGLMLRGEGEAADAHNAFDDAAEHLAKRLRRYHRRFSAHTRDLASRAQPEAGRQYVLRAEDEDTVRPAPGQTEVSLAYATIIAEAPTEISRLSVSEAVMRMDLADQTVLMFRNSTTGELNVVYRRADGHIGWIDPTGRS
jgi:ribosomal subunit interface protein